MKNYDRIIPENNPEVAAVMRELNVGRRRAYSIVRERRKETIDTKDIGNNQRIAVLSALALRPASGRDARELNDALHAEGVKTDMHDTVKTLWSLQKTHAVTFRERNRSLTNIKITPDGMDLLDALVQNGQAQVEAIIEADKTEEATTLRSVDVSVGGGQRTTNDAQVTVTKMLSEYDLGTSLQQLLARADRAAKLEEASKILEEVGETEIAVNLLEKASFTELEKDVLALIRELQGQGVMK